MSSFTMPSLAAVFLVVACGGASAPPAAPSTTTNASSSGEGAECGDDVAIQKKCAPGLTCVPKPNAPVSEHAPGVCKKP